MSRNVNVDGSQRERRKLKPLVSEILRPQALSDLILPMRTIHGLQRALESGSMVNMVFYGPPGTGKTSAAEIYMNAVGGSLTINHSTERAPLSELMQNFFVRSRGKICFIDEAHWLSEREQAALPGLMDRFSGKGRLLLAATDITKLTPQVRSGLKEINFEAAPEDRKEVQERFMERVENILSAKGFTFDKVRLEQAIEENFPDLRSVANHIEFEFA